MKKTLLVAAGVAIGLLLGIAGVARAATILFPSGGGTGTSTAPASGEFLVGNASGKYDLKTAAALGLLTDITDLISAGSNVSLSGSGTAADPYVISSTGGGGGGGGISTSTPWTTGQLVQVAGNSSVKSIATSSLGLLTTNVAEGSNLYWTNARFDTRLAATTSLPNITTLAGLSLPYSQLTGTPTIPTKTSDLTNDSGFITGLSAFDTGDLTEGSNLYFTDTRAEDAVGGILADTGRVNLSYTGGLISADIVGSSITSSYLGSAVNASLALADSALQSGDNVSELTNDAGYLTGNQTITLSGDVSGSGTTAITTSIGSGKVLNTMLANSTISGVSLGSNLANLTATDSTLTFSGSYNGATARTIGLNLGNANTWTGLQTFSAGASTTDISASGQFFADNGTASLPSYSFSGDTNTGIYNPAANNLYLVANGISALKAFSTGVNIPGILKSDITGGWLLGSGDGSLSNILYSFNDDTNTGIWSSAADQIDFATGGVNRLFINANGGIGLTEQKPATSTSMTLDWSATGPQVLYQIGTSATTITLTNATTSAYAGSRKLVMVCNPASGTAGALSWVGVTWAGGTAPTQTTTANKCDAYSFFVSMGTSTSAYSVYGAATTNF